MSTRKFGRRELFRRAAVTGAGIGVAGVGLGVNEAHAQSPDVPMADKVPRRKLGTTGETVPILFFGGSKGFDPTYDKLLHRGFREGINYVDTAEGYANGQSHVTLAPFIEQVGRENLWITSKSGMFGRSAAPPDLYLRTIEKEFDVLKTDYLDAYFFHGLMHPECLEPEYLKMVDGLKKRGRIKYFGFSCHDGNVVELMNKAAKIGAPGVDMIMFRYNFTQYGDLELNKAIDNCVKAGIGLLGMKSQSSVPTDSQKVKEFQSENFTLGQAKLKAAWADERISGFVSGMTNMQILRENITAAKTMVDLTAKEMVQLNRYAAEMAHLNCKGCNHICEGKIDGNLRVADQLRYLMYDECYGDREDARQLYAKLAHDERDFERVDLTEATRACPQGINIRERLEHAKSRLA